MTPQDAKDYVFCQAVGNLTIGLSSVVMWGQLLAGLWLWTLVPVYLSVGLLAWGFLLKGSMWVLKQWLDDTQ